MNNFQFLALMLLFLLHNKQSEPKENPFFIEKENISIKKKKNNNKSNFVQVIVQSDDFDKHIDQLKYLGNIKYRLPMIQSYVLEVERTKLNQIENMNHLFKVEVDTHITAQMKRAREIIDVAWAHDQGIYGEGVGVAVVDTGICEHPDFTYGTNRLVAFKDFVYGREKPYDDNGHGTHVAGIIGSSGYCSEGEYIGIAPKCNIIAIKVLNNKGNGNISDVLAGLQWIIDNKEKYNIRIVNISVGTSINEKISEDSLLVKGVNAVWDNGIVVVVAAGNNGPKPMSISTPGISRKVITVGASDDDISVELSGNRASDYSGRGPTVACIKKPDVVAPGSNIISCNVKDNLNNRNGHGIKNYRVNRVNSKVVNQPRNYFSNMYTTKSGTSMATPLVSGAIALLISEYPDLSNKDIKLKLINSAIDLGYPWSKQGWGLLNIPKLFE